MSRTYNPFSWLQIPIALRTTNVVKSINHYTAALSTAASLVTVTITAIDTTKACIVPIGGPAEQAAGHGTLLNDAVFATSTTVQLKYINTSTIANTVGFFVVEFQ